MISSPTFVPHCKRSLKPDNHIYAMLRLKVSLPMNLATWILPLLVPLPWSAVGVDATCYNYEGKEMPNIYACDATAKVSPCCGSNDFCLSNGLCLDAGGNNGFTQQGCTSKNWDFPCQQYCPNRAGKAGTFYSSPFLRYHLHRVLIYCGYRGLSLFCAMFRLRCKG